MPCCHSNHPPSLSALCCQMQDGSIGKLGNGCVTYLPRQLVLSQLYDVVANNGKAGFPVEVELTIVDAGGI